MSSAVVQIFIVTSGEQEVTCTCAVDHMGTGQCRCADLHRNLRRSGPILLVLLQRITWAVPWCRSSS